jgi:hypothetical protein
VVERRLSLSYGNLARISEVHLRRGIREDPLPSNACSISRETKEGDARTNILYVWSCPENLQAKIVLLIGFIRATEPADTAGDIVAQALGTSYNPPKGWGGRFIWITVLDPLKGQWIISTCIEKDGELERTEYTIIPIDEVETVASVIDTVLKDNIVTYS